MKTTGLTESTKFDLIELLRIATKNNKIIIKIKNTSNIRKNRKIIIVKKTWKRL